MTYQTTVLQSPAVALEGMLAHGYQMSDQIHNGPWAGATGLKAGRFLVLTASTEKTPELPDATGEITGPRALGVSILLTGKEQAADGSIYQQYEQVSYIRKGLIWVLAEDAVTSGANAFVRFAAGVGEELGRFRSDADTTDAVAHAGLVWRSSTTGADQLALLEVNLPGVAA